MTSIESRSTPVTRMPPEAMATYLVERLEDKIVDRTIAYGQLTVTVVPAALPIAVQLCRDDPRLGFDFFDFISGVDEREDGFAVVVHLYSIRHRHHIQIRALADGGREAPHLPTISHLYLGADWHERECYDMFGITFDGHPGLLPRILTVENFEGFPLRKEFLLMSREVKPWPGLKEPKEVEDQAGEDDDGAAPAGPSAEEKARMAREKAERAKAKAAEARKRRARERAERSEAAGGDSGERAERSEAAGGDSGERAERSEAAGGDSGERAERSEAAGGDSGERAERSEAAGGDSGERAEQAALRAAGAGEDEAASDPQRAAAIADDAVAKDAAAGAVGGDTAAGAPGDVPGEDQPVEDADREAELASGAAATASGTPGVEAEGRHAGAEGQSGAQPAGRTPGMTSATQDAEAARPAEQTPAPDADVSQASQEDAGGPGLPPRGPGEEEPRALAGDGVGSVPLSDETDPVVGETVTEQRASERPIGTDADDRLRRLEADQPVEDADDDDGEGPET